MKEKKYTFPPIIGVSSLLTIFAVLCLTLFSLLTISTAEAERRLSDISAQATSDYYKADSEAELIFARIRNGDIPDDVIIDNDIYIYSCRISSALVLQIQLRFRDGDWTVLSWQPISSNR